jgi:hypothetical protein
LDKQIPLVDIANVFGQRNWYEDSAYSSRLQSLAHDVIHTWLSPRNHQYVLRCPLQSSLSNRVAPAIRNYQATRVSIHFRGCDYLSNTPEGHQPNLPPDKFLDIVLPMLPTNATIFLATDDHTMISSLRHLGLNILYFKDVDRGTPGRGIHSKTLFQNYGLEAILAPRNRGLQVLRDCVHLSKGDIFFGSNSNIMFFASLLNPAMKLVNLSLS